MLKKGAIQKVNHQWGIPKQSVFSSNKECGKLTCDKSEKDKQIKTAILRWEFRFFEIPSRTM